MARATNEIRGYHAHVYYDPSSRPRAAELRAAIEEQFEVVMGRWRDEPVGPHPQSMYQVAFAPEEFARVVPWLMLNRAGLNVLVHPETGARHRYGEFADAAAKRPVPTEEQPLKSPDQFRIIGKPIPIVDTKGIDKRDLGLAMKLAERAVELSKSEDAAILDTLARVFYEKGELERAIEWQRKAVEQLLITDESPMAKQIRETLKAYEAAMGEAETEATEDAPPATPKKVDDER